MKIVVGQKYLMRNGAKVHVTEKRNATYGDRQQHHMPFLLGVVMATGERLTWREDGKYPAVDAPPHEWDIVGPVKKKARR